jgi:hypothetical protein
MLFSKPLFVSFALTILLASCEREKDIRKRPFKANTTTWYRISPTAPAPVTIGGVNYTTIAVTSAPNDAVNFTLM